MTISELGPASSPTIPENPAAPLLEVDHLVVEFKTKDGVVQAVSDISFDIARGETLSIVGESGSGKSTTAKAVMQLLRYKEGSIRYGGRALEKLSRAELRRTRPDLQMIFQDPSASLNPRLTTEKIVSQGLEIWPDRTQKDVATDVDELLRQVGMDPTVVRGRRAGEFSGGQCQRIAIARVLAMRPELVVCDEPVSALDVSVQAQVLNLLRRLRREYGLTMLFISHDLSVVRNISDRVLVMYLGKTCEVGPVDEMFSNPKHPYTRLLLDSVPQIDSAVAATRQPQVSTATEIPSPLAPPSGCRFRTRCPLATDRCSSEEPELREVGEGRQVACHYA
jgi:peptide/nickel transport system ATP-binding protein